MTVAPGELRATARRVSARALASGAQIPIATERVVVEDGGIPFLVHHLSRIEKKLDAGRIQAEEHSNPFLPPDPELTVAELSATHLCVLNKFNVLDEHLLIITRHFESQDELLTEADFHALAVAMADMGGLGFYNAGTVAGASQAHKHLQLVPTPLGSGSLPTPVDAVLDELPAAHPATHPALPFAHLILGLSGDAISPHDATCLNASYRQMLGLAGISSTNAPYNLLLTPAWMMLVPRRTECFEGISVNALGFAGSLLVPDRARLDRIREIGPRRVLHEVARPD